MDAKGREDLLDFIVSFLENMKIEYIKIYDVTGKFIFADYFVVASTSSTVHLDATASKLIEELKKKNIGYTIEGEAVGGWILLAVEDVWLHLFLEERREFYAIEDLWQ